MSLIASGQTSAFALTEPSAGSDTARVATRASLKELELSRNNCGAYVFKNEECEERRTNESAYPLLILFFSLLFRRWYLWIVGGKSTIHFP